MHLLEQPLWSIAPIYVTETIVHALCRQYLPMQKSLCGTAHVKYTVYFNTHTSQTIFYSQQYISPLPLRYIYSNITKFFMYSFQRFNYLCLDIKVFPYQKRKNKRRAMFHVCAFFRCLTKWLIVAVSPLEITNGCIHHVGMLVIKSAIAGCTRWEGEFFSFIQIVRNEEESVEWWIPPPVLQSETLCAFLTDLTPLLSVKSLPAFSVSVAEFLLGLNWKNTSVLVSL